MKKLYTLSLVLFACATSFAQTFFSENMGTPTTNTFIVPYATEGTAPATFQNTSPIVFTGTGDVRTSSASSGYAGASGGGNVFLTNNVDRFFQISGLNTSAYASADLQLTFGLNAGANLPILEVSTNGTSWTAVAYTAPGTGWKLVTVSGGLIPSSSTLSLRWSQINPLPAANNQYRIDDVKLSSVSASCTLSLGAGTTACDANTSGMDTYTATIPFTGGGTATYGLTVNSGVIGGDNPSTTATGNIVITGIVEGTAITVTALGGTCNISVDVTAADCKAINTLPFKESFNYTADTPLTATQNWVTVNTGDALMVTAGNLNYTGINSSGNSVSFAGAGAEAALKATPVTSGTYYASFLMNVTDMTGFTASTSANSTYFAALSNTAIVDYRARIFVKKSGEGYVLGGSNTSAATDASFGPTTFSVGQTVLVIIGYDFGTNVIKYWFNPTVATFTAATPATVTETPAAAPSAAAITNLTGFAFRQDDVATTPNITIDELTLGTTPQSVLSVSQNNSIAGLKVYPNPLTGRTLFIESNANAEKAVVIYDVLGKQVLNTKTSNNSVNVAQLNGGVYIVKITEEGNTATRKLVIK